MKLMYLSFAVSLLAPSALRADDAELLAGKWSVNKTEQGQKLTQTIEIKKDKFTFEILNDGQAVLHAEGDVKFDKLGPFNSVHFFHIRAGDSASNLQDVDEERTSVYLIDGDTWIRFAHDLLIDHRNKTFDLMFVRVRHPNATDFLKFL